MQLTLITQPREKIKTGGMILIISLRAEAEWEAEWEGGGGG